jgi:hypothetical protein
MFYVQVEKKPLYIKMKKIKLKGIITLLIQTVIKNLEAGKFLKFISYHH